MAQLERDGWGQIEVHLHHDHDTAAGLTEKLMRFKEDLYQRHGLLYKDDKGDIRYGFIHGNWALCNSRPDGRWCGVDNELDVLRETGCYADYTLPSAPVPTQTRTVNQIYYPTATTAARLPHDLGERAQVGRQRDDQLLLIQGPLALNWSRRKAGILPRLENGNLDRGQPPTISRMKQWLNASVQVAGWPDATFVKLHTHGAKPDNADMLLGEPMVEFHRDLICFCEEREINLAYVTAREMYSLVKSAEAGITDPRLVLSAAPAQSLQAG